MDDTTTKLKDEEKDKLAEELTAVSNHRASLPNLPDLPDLPRQQNSSSWIPGLILVLIGFIFLAANLWDFELENWWALFILIPAFGNFNSAYEKYQRTGRLTRGARSSMGWGIFFVILSATFLFNISWNLMWPILLILLGIGFIINR
jgi:hypothetical protein